MTMLNFQGAVHELPHPCWLLPGRCEQWRHPRALPKELPQQMEDQVRQDLEVQVLQGNDLRKWEIKK